MNLTPHTPAEYTQALKALLPPGRAWEWKANGGGLGHRLLSGTAEEPARLESGIPGVLDNAIDTHRPKYSSWHIDEYRRVAAEALEAAGIVEALPRKMFAVGSHVGDRLWSHAVNDPDSGADFPVPLVAIFHLFAPMTIGRPVGDGLGGNPAARLWSVAGRTRYILLVRYYRSVAPPAVIARALLDFRQAHVFLWFEDITGAGGHLTFND
ncbi:MAG: hypothetical protein LBF93_06605 [Zoogloeaceae bacterium]|jgi:hypothetical protein|nr:hypothetical protein [Zoogloeaceae bacterium]